MLEIIKHLLVLLQWQAQVISFLCVLAFGKNFKPKVEKCIDKEFVKLTVDPLPIFGEPPVVQRWQYAELLEQYRLEHGKELKPVNRRGGIVPPKEAVCPHCGAPPEYAYDNNGGRGEYWCKVCNSKFSIRKPSKDDEPYCPFCYHKLDLIKQRSSFDVYRCPHLNCSYRQKKLSAMTPEQKALYKESPHLFKLRYIYRKFHFNFTPLSKQNECVPLVDLPKITASPHVLGLILTYHINYAIPLRKTAALMYDVHGVKVSHQTIANYCNAVAPRVKPLVDHFAYELSNSFCGDETYIKIGGVWHYIFFFFDAVKKIILSYRVQKLRDWKSAVLAINDVLVKLKEIPKNLNLITDGNPIYLLAQHWFAQHGISFDVTQVIGLTNDDEVSKEYRPLKQIIERLNRTFKGNYKPTTGYGADVGAISKVTLFTAYFNFLRPHSGIDGGIPAPIPELEALPHMPAKWCELIRLGEKFAMDNAA
ncbi:MAG: DDE-type integrase/transposase/recombinase [Oscillospiraceae bacterium]|jgi:transposase-like protein|nr:DDE-type integrase/transposase/recombinase [Oscillospiraceae bacterium]